MKSQKPIPARNARSPGSLPTLIPAPVSQTLTPTGQTKDKQDEEKLEDVLKNWSSTPTRKSLPFLNDLHKVGRLYDNIARSRSHSREKQFDAYDETRSHLNNILKSDNNKGKSDDDAKFTPQKTTQLAPRPHSLKKIDQARKPTSKLLHRQKLNRFEINPSRGDANPLPSTPVLKLKTAMFPGNSSIAEPTAPGSKALDETPWRRASPPTPTPSRKGTASRDPKMPITLKDHPSPKTVPETPPSAPITNTNSNLNPSPQPFSRPIPIHIKKKDPPQDDTEKSHLPLALLPPLDLPLPPMRPIPIDDAEEKYPHLHLKPIYTQSYVNGVIEALKHAHSTIATLSQEKREAESRLGGLEEKQGVWHALVHGQGCGCGEGRWWGVVEEVLIDWRGGEHQYQRERGKKGKKMGEGEEEGGFQFGIDGACDERDDDEWNGDEDDWDMVFGGSVGSPGVRDAEMVDLKG